MGQIATGKCLDCGETFIVNHGGGFFFYLLRCDRCGKTKSMRLDDLADRHTRFGNGLPGPYPFSRMETNEQVRKNALAELIPKDDYHNGIEGIAGNCGCGGKYTMDAPPRCPKCHSTRIEEGEIILIYD